MSIKYALWQWIILVPLLLICSYTDCKKRQIPIFTVIVASVITIGIHSLYESTQWIELLFSCLPGTILIVLHFLSKKNVGLGDAGMVLLIGCVAGFERGVMVLFTASTLASVVAAYLFIVKKKRITYQIPFAPFLLITTIICGFI